MQTYQTKRKAPDRAVPPVQEAAPSKSEMLHLSGAGAPQPMSPALREKFEPGFSADFSNIRISRGHIPEELGVRAVAQGTDILLDQSAGMDVLGHELAHVVQQAQGRVEGGFPVVENAALEHEADVMGARAASGLSAQVGSENGFGGEAMSIAPMSATSAPAQCKSREEKKAEKAAKAKQKRRNKYASAFRDYLASNPKTRVSAYDPQAASDALDKMAPIGMASVQQNALSHQQGMVSAGDIFNYFRGGKLEGTPDERGRYYQQLRNVGRETNASVVAALVDDADSVADTDWTSIKGMRAAASDEESGSSPEQRAKIKGDFDQIMNQSALDMGTYLSLLEQNPDAMAALKQAQNKVFNPMIDKGYVGSKEESAARTLNEMILRSLGPEAGLVKSVKGVDEKAANKTSLRVQAMMANQTALMSHMTDPTNELSDSVRTLQQIQRDFFIRNGFMDDPATAPATPAQPTAPAPQAAPPQPTVQAQPTAPAQQAVVPPAQLPTAAIPLQTAQHTPPPLPARPRVMPHPNLQDFRRPTPPSPTAPMRKPVIPNAKLLWDQFNRQRG